MRQRLTLLLTCSIRSRRWWSAWLASCCSRVSSCAAGFLRRHEDLHLGERERQEAQILQQPTPSGEGIGRGLGNAQIMDTAAVGVAQKEDDEQGIDEQDIFDRVVFFLAAITLCLFSRVLGADDAPFGPVMGKRGEAGAAAGCGDHGCWLLLQRGDHGGRVGLRDAEPLGQGRQGAGGASPRVRSAASSAGKRT